MTRRLTNCTLMIYQPNSPSSVQEQQGDMCVGMSDVQTKDANDVRNKRISENKKVYPIPKEVQDENGNWNGGIPFNEGKPDFSFLSRGTVKISPFTEKRYQNFKRARIAYCEQRTPPVSQTKVRNWMKKNGYTWHEVDETGRMEKVPSIIHGNICHFGGISMAKQSTSNRSSKGFNCK